MVLGITAVALLCLSVSTSASPCPNSCSGNGNCDDSSQFNTRCDCFKGFTGADCSLRTCPLGPAWTDIATANDEAHALVECSNRGLCDRETGTCECAAGEFVGSACERMACKNQCNNKGICATMRTKASMREPGDLIDKCSSLLICADPSNCVIADYLKCQEFYSYTGWDADMVSGCVCDPGWFGPDCTLRRCPTGDDPFTGMIGDVDGVQVNEKQIVTCVANGGSFTLEFDGQTTEAISFDAAVGDLVTHLEALKNVNSDYGSAIKVTYTGSNVIACTDAGNAITIEFLQNFGALPLLTPDGSRLDHSSALFEPLITSTTSVTGTKENVECSNRGICEENTGVCTCSEGYATSNGYSEAGQRGDCGFATETITDCPGEVACNGVGVCSGAPRYLCDCIEGYSGADCTEMVCPSGRSWFDFPVSTNSAHYSRTVCSDAGRCDKSTGTCECMAGFTGAACERTACAGDDVFCSGNGHCESVEQMARHANNNGDFLDVTYGVVENNPATWDYDKLYGCSCDAGFGGYDCSEMSCPFGDDPDSVEGQFNEVQEVTCEESDGSTDSSFTLKFRQETTASIAYTATVQDVEAALEALGGMLDVNVYLDASLAGTAVCGNNGGGVGGNVFYVEFFYPTGDVPLITGTGSGLESLTVVNSVRGNKEFLECSGRGRCNLDTGICRCTQGYGSSDGQSGPGGIGDCGMRMVDIVGKDEASIV